MKKYWNQKFELSEIMDNDNDTCLMMRDEFIRNNKIIRIGPHPNNYISDLKKYLRQKKENSSTCYRCQNNGFLDTEYFDHTDGFLDVNGNVFVVAHSYHDCSEEGEAIKEWAKKNGLNMYVYINCSWRLLTGTTLIIYTLDTVGPPIIVNKDGVIVKPL